MMYPCEFNKTLSIVSQNRVQRNRFWSKFDILMPPVTLEIRSRSPKSNPLIPLLQWCIHVSMIRIHLSVHEIGCIQAFLSNFNFRMTPVTLKISSRSQKFTNLFSLSKWSTNANLIGIHQLVNEAGWRQAVWSKFDIPMSTVTLKLESRSEKFYGWIASSQ